MRACGNWHPHMVYARGIVDIDARPRKCRPAEIGKRNPAPVEQAPGHVTEGHST
jgi:hypothetical protein